MANPEPCIPCAYYGMMACRETVGICDRCGKRGDVYMDYSHSGDREKPDDTVCLDCLAAGAHIPIAHENKEAVAWGLKIAADRGPRECVWSRVSEPGEDDGLTWWECATHLKTEMGGETEEPSFPCELWLDEAAAARGEYKEENHG